MTPKEIRSRRLALGLSVEAFAHALGVAPDIVRALENGEDVRLPDHGLLERVLAGLESASAK